MELEGHRVSNAPKRGTGWQDEDRGILMRGDSQVTGLRIPGEDWPSLPRTLFSGHCNWWTCCPCTFLSTLLSLLLTSPFSFSFLFFFFPLSLFLCLLSIPTLLRYPTVSRGTQPRDNSANFCSHLHSLLAYTFYILDANYNSCFKILVWPPLHSREKKSSSTHQNTNASFPNQQTSTSQTSSPTHWEKLPQ